MFKFFYRPPHFFRRGQFLPKITNFGDFWGRKGHIFKTTAAKFCLRVRSWGSLPQTNIVKKTFKGIYPFGANLYQKLPFLAMFLAVSPHLLSQNGKIWREGANLGYRPQAKFCKNSLKGVYPFWANLYQKNTNFGDFGCCTPTCFNPQWRNLAWGCEPGASSSKPYFVRIA